MAAQTQDGSQYFVWQVPRKPVAIHLHLEIVDRLLADVMRGFAAIPRRGAEVGGILLGTIEHGDPSIVHVEDYEPVESEYKSGPSYLLSDEDRARFRDVCDHWQPDESRPLYAVGYYRGNTRDALSFSSEDSELMDEFFPSPSHIALLIKPSNNHPGLAGFFFREDGVFPSTTPREFPFRRREIFGVVEPARPRRESPAFPDSAAPRTAASASSTLRAAVWIPLSFVFLLFGVALGLMIALARSSAASPRDAPDFSLGLSVSPSDDNLSVRWDRDAPAIRSAERGVLEIEDGSYTKSVDLDVAQLKNGSIIYRNASGAVRFRLMVYPRTRITLTETAEWKR